MRSTFFTPLALAGGLLLTACGGGSGSSEATVPADAGLVVTAVDPLAWDAGEYTATAGDVVVALQNSSSLPHNLHFVDADGAELPAALDVSSRGDVDTETVALAAGTYTLICKVPGHSSMKATLTVT